MLDKKKMQFLGYISQFYLFLGILRLYLKILNFFLISDNKNSGGRGLVSSGYEWNTFVCVSLRLESQKALEKQSHFRGSLCFQLVVLISSKRLYNIHVTWFDWFLRRKGDSTALQ